MGIVARDSGTTKTVYPWPRHRSSVGHHHVLVPNLEFPVPIAFQFWWFFFGVQRSLAIIATYFD